MARKKKKIRVIDWLNLGMFQGALLFTCGYDKKEICDYLKKIGANDWLEAMNDITIDVDHWYSLKRTVENLKTGEVKRFLFIIIPRYEFLDDDFVKLAHEIIHTCQFYLPGMNVERDREIECEAYFHTHLMRQCIQKLRGKK
jgi:DNA-binding cell septation regulator SpoVG